MSDGKSGAQKGMEALGRFRDWIAERDRAGDWDDYLRGGKLSRTDIAAECLFGTPAFRQNPGIRDELAALEARLGLQTVSEAADTEQTAHNGSNQVADANSDRAVAARLVRAKASADQRIKTLEEENAALRAENDNLRETQKRFLLLEEYLGETGRMIRP